MQVEWLEWNLEHSTHLLAVLAIRLRGNLLNYKGAQASLLALGCANLELNLLYIWCVYLEGCEKEVAWVGLIFDAILLAHFIFYVQ